MSLGLLVFSLMGLVLVGVYMGQFIHRYRDERGRYWTLRVGRWWLCLGRWHDDEVEDTS